MTTHAELIDRLGGGTAVARALIQATGSDLNPDRFREAVYKWKVHGVPHRWRAHVRRLAEAFGEPVPADLLETAVEFDASAIKREAVRSAGGVENKVNCAGG